MEREYAQALVRSLKAGTSEESLVTGLVKHLKEEGRTKLLPGILRELKSMQAREAKLLPSVEVASESEAATALKEANAAGIDAKEAHVNPSLIRGWRARANGILVDRSAKRALTDLYQRITN